MSDRQDSSSVATIEVAAGLIFRNGKLLIAQRFPEAHLGGLWEFPGGKLEPGETFEQCLERELAEELGIAVKINALLEILTHDYPGKRVELRFFRCDWIRHEPRPLGCAAVLWVGLHQLKDYDFPAADESILARLQAEPSLWTGNGVKGNEVDESVN
jgi:mutator protein MutT